MAKRNRIPKTIWWNQSLFRVHHRSTNGRSAPPKLELVKDPSQGTLQQCINAEFCAYIMVVLARAKKAPTGAIGPAISALIGRPVPESVAWEWLLDKFLEEKPEYQEPRYADLIALGRSRVRQIRDQERRKIERERIDREAAEARAKYAEERKANGGEKQFYESGKWKTLRYKVLLESNGCCKLCGRSTREHGVILHVDHIKPRSRFPNLAMEKSNLQVLCADCNFGKRNHDTVDWSEGRVA